MSAVIAVIRVGWSAVGKGRSRIGLIDLGGQWSGRRLRLTPTAKQTFLAARLGGRLGSVRRKKHSYRGAVTHLALNRNLPAMRLHDLAGDSETKTQVPAPGGCPLGAT